MDRLLDDAQPIRAPSLTTTRPPAGGPNLTPHWLLPRRPDRGVRTHDRLPLPPREADPRRVHPRRRGSPAELRVHRGCDHHLPRPARRPRRSAAGGGQPHRGCRHRAGPQETALGTAAAGENGATTHRRRRRRPRPLRQPASLQVAAADGSPWADLHGQRIPTPSRCPRWRSDSNRRRPSETPRSIPGPWARTPAHPGVGPILATPLPAEDGVRGAVSIGRTAPGSPFSDGDTAMMTEFAAHAGLAVQLESAAAGRNATAGQPSRARLATHRPRPHSRPDPATGRLRHHRAQPQLLHRAGQGRRRTSPTGRATARHDPDRDNGTAQRLTKRCRHRTTRGRPGPDAAIASRGSWPQLAGVG